MEHRHGPPWHLPERDALVPAPSPGDEPGHCRDDGGGDAERAACGGHLGGPGGCDDGRADVVPALPAAAAAAAAAAAIPRLAAAAAAAAAPRLAAAAAAGPAPAAVPAAAAAVSSPP